MMADKRNNDVTLAERRVQERERQLQQHWGHVRRSAAMQVTRPSTLGALAIAGLIIGRLRWSKHKGQVVEPSLRAPSRGAASRGFIPAALIALATRLVKKAATAALRTALTRPPLSQRSQRGSRGSAMRTPAGQ